MTIRLCRVCRGWHDPHKWPAECIQAQQSKAAAFPVPMLRSDSIRPVQSQVDGRMYDSRSALYRHYEQSGVRVMDAGERTGPAPAPKTTAAEIKAAIQQAGLA